MNSIRHVEWCDNRQETLFAIVDATLDSTAVADFYATGGSDAFPLFAGTSYAAQAEQGPWLLPSPPAEFWDKHPKIGGFWVSSGATSEIVRKHWQSLIDVAREGNIVWFRYADNRILPKILSTFTQSEVDELLGPCSALWVNDVFWQQSSEAVFTPRPAPWFRLQPHHLTPLYDENRHAYILSRHFWQRMEGMMICHPTPEATIAHVLTIANQAHLPEDILDGVIAGAVALQAGMDIEVLQSPLMLTDDELAQVKNWLSKKPELTGAV